MAHPKTWLVTGSSRGLGRRIVEAVLSEGGNIVATARDTSRIDDLVPRYGRRVRTVNLDVTDESAAERAIAVALDAFGTLDVLVNNAGYADIASIEDMQASVFRAQIDANFYGVVNLTRAALPAMRKQRSGHIIQISSIGGRIGAPGLGAYQAAKWAVGGFSEVLAKEVRPFGIKVTIAEPGAMRTDWAGSSMDTFPVRDAYKDVIEPTIRRLRESDGRQPGDPSRVARVLTLVAAMDDPPLHLLLGNDAINLAKVAAEALASSDAKWENLSRSVSFED